MSYLIYPTTYRQVSTISLLKEYFPSKSCIPVVDKAYFFNCDTIKSDVSILDNRFAIGVPATDKFSLDDNLEKVCITQNIYDINILAKINNFANNTKKIIDCTYCDDINTIPSLKERLEIQNKNHNISDFDYFEGCLSSNQKASLFDINIPIIGIGGLIGFCNQSEIATKLSLELSKNNISTKAIVTEKTHCLLNSIAIPDEVFSNKISFLEKVVLLNHYIKFITIKYGCEALVVEIPGGLMKFSNQILNDIGQYAYLFVEAMPISNFVLCVPSNRYNYNFYKNISLRMDSKFEWNTIGIHMSNAHVDYASIKRNSPNYLLFRNMNSLYNYTIEILNSANNDNIIIESLAVENSFNLLIEKILDIL